MGAATALWYALPDHVASRRSRAVAKAALGVAVVSRSLVGDLRRARRRGGGPVVDDAAAGSPPPMPTEPPQGPVGPREGDRASWVGAAGAAGLLGLAAGAVVGSVALAAAVERVVHRIGERAALRGTFWPHTRNGVVLGSLAALAVLGGRGAPQP